MRSTTPSGSEAEDAEGEERIATREILVYSAPVLGVFFANSLISFYFLKYATDVLLIVPALAGTILLGGRIWDAVTDPLVGHWSDRTRSRMGRRRPWFLASAVPLGLSVIALWSPPETLTGRALTLWLAVAFLVYLTFYTTFRVPHMALGAELTRGYHDRTRVFGVMQIVENAGILLAAGGLAFIENADAPREAAATLSRGIAVMVIVLVLWASWRLRERSEFQGRGGAGSYRAFRDVMANPHARLLVGIFFLEQLGFASLLTLMPYLSDYVVQTPGRTFLYLMGAIVSMAASVPAWIVLSRRFGKRAIWIGSLIAKLVIFASLAIVGEGDAALLAIGAIAFGVVAGAGNVVGPSLKADVIDWDEAESGERKEGAYFAAWNFVQKAAGGFSGWMIGIVLTATGFVANAAQGEAALLGIRLLASPWPLLLHALALVLVWRFTLDEAAHRAARDRAGSRRTG
ncbi:MAG: MFS transporter [Myxococcales bacterium]|nr:MFS transporter [Myxococcales bacterium]